MTIVSGIAPHEPPLSPHPESRMSALQNRLAPTIAAGYGLGARHSCLPECAADHPRTTRQRTAAVQLQIQQPDWHAGGFLVIPGRATGRMRRSAAGRGNADEADRPPQGPWGSPSRWRSAEADPLAGRRVAGLGPAAVRVIVRRVRVAAEEVRGDACSRRRRTVPKGQMALLQRGRVGCVFSYSFVLADKLATPPRLSAGTANAPIKRRGSRRPRTAAD